MEGGKDQCGDNGRNGEGPEGINFSFLSFLSLVCKFSEFPSKTRERKMKPYDLIAVHFDWQPGLCDIHQ